MANEEFEYSEVLARHYDEDYAHVRADAGDVTFYRDLALAGGGAVLEVGCGTGRVLLPIARAGLPATGVDASPAMIAALEAKVATEPPEVRARCRVALGRFEALGVDGPFALVYSAFRAFQHLETRPQKLAALREMKRVLAPDGVLAFDVFDFNAALVADGPVERVDYSVERDGHLRERHSIARYDENARILDGTFHWYVDGEMIERAHFRMAVSTLEELESLLDEAGLQRIAVHGDFDRSPRLPDNPRELIVLAAHP